MQNVFIIGSKGIPANYGGFETFVEKLTEKQVDRNIQYHVSCLVDDKKKEEYIHNGARCFNVQVPNIGGARAVIYDLISLNNCIKYIEENQVSDSIIYILACRIGPFLSMYKHKIKKFGITVYVNPDGHEWKRSKWNWLIRKYWKLSEKLMIKHSNIIVCDSIGIEEYIKNSYSKYKPKTTFIPYGADTSNSTLEDNSSELLDYYRKFDIKSNEYYLIVGRFVPENNYELIIREYMKSTIKKDLVIITNKEENKFYDKLVETTNFPKDKRIKFIGTLYDQNLLKKVREQAFGYIHGHEVGGTNPSLLEALATTKLNVLYNVIFNKEVGKEGALYFNKKEGDLANLLNSLESLSAQEITSLGEKAKHRILESYRWELIVSDYEKLFSSNTNNLK